jgi:hypothetical protein
MNLLVGIQGQGLHLKVLKEILNHQGVIFEERINETYYPCIIQTNLEINDRMENHNVIIADKIIPMERIIVILSGELNQNLRHPDINKYEIQLVEEVRKIMHGQGLPFVRKWFWPEFKKACFIMTHDIDRINIPPINTRHETPIIIKLRLYILYAFKKYFLNVKKFDDYIDLIIEIENRYNIKSSFYFFPKYEEHEKFINILNNLKIEKFEIGLHSESENYEQLKREKELLEGYIDGKVFGTRQHLLKFTAPQTWQYQEKLLDYDLTFYYNEEFGYRAGLCFPFRPLNTESILEVPTSFMDWTALHKKMNYEQIKRVITGIINTVKTYNGCLIFNFHNEYFNKLAFPDISQTFTDVLEYTQKDYWTTTAHECVKWWKIRESTKIDIELENGSIFGTSSYEIPIIIESKDNSIRYLNTEKRFSVEY